MLTARSKRVVLALAATASVGALAAPTAAVASGSPAPHLSPGTIGAPAQDANPLPPLAATADPLSQAAGRALWALHYGDPVYPSLLDEVAHLVADRGNVNPTVVAHVWSETDSVRMTAVLSALTQIGVSYRRYTAEAGAGFDCSGLTSWAWANAGVVLAHSSWRQINWAKPVEPGLTRPGDLVYYPGHIMMAIGVGDAIIHSPFTGSVVEVRPVPAGGAGRVRAGSPV